MDERRTAEQILSDVTDGKLEANQVNIRETTRLVVRDLDLGTEEERIITQDAPRALHRTADGLTISDHSQEGS